MSKKTGWELWVPCLVRECRSSEGGKISWKKIGIALSWHSLQYFELAVQPMDSSAYVNWVSSLLTGKERFAVEL